MRQGFRCEVSGFGSSASGCHIRAWDKVSGARFQVSGWAHQDTTFGPEL